MEMQVTDLDCEKVMGCYRFLTTGTGLCPGASCDPSRASGVFCSVPSRCLGSICWVLPASSGELPSQKETSPTILFSPRPSLGFLELTWKSNPV